MIIIISLILLIGLGILLTWKDSDSYTGIIGVLLAGISSILLTVSLICLITEPLEVKSGIDEFLATKTTIELARKNEVGIENAAVRCKIIESNQWLAKQQYYNDTIFGLWIPDKVDKLKPIE